VQAELVPGVLMPTVGYGTAGLGDLTADAVFTAIRVGYRLVDSAGVSGGCVGGCVCV
jgi:diketogulonate reductase-like aldo/keto reductase